METHLLSSLGILASFSIAKKITTADVKKISKRIKKVYNIDDTDKENYKRLVSDALIENATKYLMTGQPPGLISPTQSSKNAELDKYYRELAEVSKVLSDKFVEQKLTPHQICFIITALVNILGIDESDFEDFHDKFNKYKKDNFNDEGGD